MKSNIISLIVLLGLIFQNAITLPAQTAKGDDLGMLALNAYVPPQIESMPPIARENLKNKLTQIVMQNGMSGSAINPRFIITANINIQSKELTATSPPMTALALDVSLYIGDGIDGTKFASTTVSVKGVGTNEAKAYIEALKNIKPADPAIQAFVQSGKTKIIEYFNSRCDVILKQAQNLAALNQYENALYNLTSVPEAATGCYDRAMTAAGPLYKKYMDKQCKEKLLQAKTAWAASQSWDGAVLAADVLSTIDPDAACYKEAITLNNEIAKRMKEVDNREWTLVMKKHDDTVSLEKAAINAYRDIGVAYGNGQPKAVSYNINGWW